MIKFIKKTKGAFAPLLLMVALNSQGFAQSEVTNTDNNDTAVEWYGGIGLSTVKAECIDGCEDITFGVVAKVGYDFNQYIGVEGRFIKTFLEYEIAKVDHIGVFAKPMLPIDENLHLYGLLGYGNTSTGDKKVFDDSGIAWGIGLNYTFDDNKESENNSTTTREDEREFGIFVDYERLLQKSDAPDFDSINIGIFYNF